MSNRVVFGALMLACCAAPAFAHIEFAQYEGKDAVQEGQGGTKIVKNDIEFWTNGTPPRKYQVLGIITDSRKDKILSGHAIGSEAIAKSALEAGGSAVILIDQNSAYAGSAFIANAYTSGGNGYARAVHDITSRFLVIKYLDQ